MRKSVKRAREDVQWHTENYNDIEQNFRHRNQQSKAVKFDNLGEVTNCTGRSNRQKNSKKAGLGLTHTNVVKFHYFWHHSCWSRKIGNKVVASNKILKCLVTPKNTFRSWQFFLKVLLRLFSQTSIVSNCVYELARFIWQETSCIKRVKTLVELKLADNLGRVTGCPLPITYVKVTSPQPGNKIHPKV